MNREEQKRRKKAQEKRRETNKERTIIERKCFVCRGFEYIVHHCRNVREERSTPITSNKFEVLKNRVMNIGEESGREIRKDKKTVLREERVKKEKSVEV